VAVPALLKALGIHEVVVLHEEMHGRFEHNPEPLRQHLDAVCEAVVQHRAHLGIVVDPDVDRLAFVMEDGRLFGEEYTLVAVADYVLAHRPGPTVSNLSSTRALQEVSARYGQPAYRSAVGEVHVVKAMRAHGAVIGGEGNGGVIYPVLHEGRDALVGIALFLSHYEEKGLSMTALRATYPHYEMAKEKFSFDPRQDADGLLRFLSEKYAAWPQDWTDGLKIDMDDSWLHVRKSNTEPILRIYTEAPDQERATALALEAQHMLAAHS
jgi:phosphomannomutase